MLVKGSPWGLESMDEFDIEASDKLSLNEQLFVHLDS